MPFYMCGNNLSRTCVYAQKQDGPPVLSHPVGPQSLCSETDGPRLPSSAKKGGVSSRFPTERAELTDRSLQVTGRTSLGTPGQLHFLRSSANR